MTSGFTLDRSAANEYGLGVSLDAAVSTTRPISSIPEGNPDAETETQFLRPSSAARSLRTERGCVPTGIDIQQVAELELTAGV